MTTEQKQTSGANAQFGSRGRSLSRQILGNDLDLVNKYASKYSSPHQASQSYHMKRNQTYSALPGAYGNYGGVGTRGGQHGYGSSSSSSTSSHGGAAAARRNRRQPSNLINSATSGQWDTGLVNTQEEDMSAAMTAMVSSYQTRVVDDANFLDEIQDEADGNESFAKPENAEDWSVKEVCFWLNKIHLDKYIKAFKDQIIDGSILLRDLDEAMLINELGIKRLHVKKILREIKALKSKCTKLKKESNDTRDELIGSLRDEIDKLKEKNKQLTAELQMTKLKVSSSYGARKAY